MPLPTDLLRIADLLKLAADTAEECSRISDDGDMERIVVVCRRLKANAEELQTLAEEIHGKQARRSS